MKRRIIAKGIKSNSKIIIITNLSFLDRPGTSCRKFKVTKSIISSNDEFFYCINVIQKCRNE